MRRKRPNVTVDERFEAWLQPIEAHAPCGPSLEYDNDFLVLQASLQPVPEVQYGQFTERREGPVWVDVERQCRALLLRSRDINLLVWLVRSRVRQAGASGLLEALGLLDLSLQRFGADIHPQPDGGDLGVRANALEALADPDGLLGDVRDILIGGNAMGRLTVRDVERARMRPRPADAPSVEAVEKQLLEFRTAHRPELRMLEASVATLRSIETWCANTLREQAPALAGFAHLMEPFAQVDQTQEPPPVIPSDPAVPDLPAMPLSTPKESTVSGSVPANATSVVEVPAVALNSTWQDARDQARASIAVARDWFELHEPSSPVGLLLRQAERLIGRPYSEVAQAIPAELVARWSDNP